MAKDVITVGGEERVVREDTAKSYRGVVWILSVIGIVILGAALLFFVFGLGTAVKDGKVESPSQIENSIRR
jgi:flagellar basal body-associated protein FliL